MAFAQNCKCLHRSPDTTHLQFFMLKAKMLWLRLNILVPTLIRPLKDSLMSLPFLVSHSELTQHFSTFDTRGKNPNVLNHFLSSSFISLFCFSLSLVLSLSSPSFPKLSPKSDSLSFPSTSNHTVCLPPSPSLCSSSLL